MNFDKLINSIMDKLRTLFGKERQNQMPSAY